MVLRIAIIVWKTNADKSVVNKLQFPTLISKQTLDLNSKLYTGQFFFNEINSSCS